MGYPGKNTKGYEAPKRPFEKQRIEDETRIVIEYGLRNKREVWRAQSVLRRYRKAARELLAFMSQSTDEQQIATKREHLLGHLNRIGLLGPDADIGDVLSLKIQQPLERRLQTMVYRQGLARSPKQARQMVTHGHIAIAGRRVDIPSYRVPRDQETQITYYGTSPLTSEGHPEIERINKKRR